MNHSFTPSAADETKCRCGYSEMDHTNRATCEVCGNSGTCNILYGNILMCQDCEAKEMALQLENNTPEKQEARVRESNEFLEIAKAIDTTVQVRTDLHNAETMAIIDIKRAIDEDTLIENKHFTLSKILEERYLSFKDKVFSLREEITKLESQQRAIQTYYNELSKKLRAEEKAQIKLKDVTYQPIEPKVVRPKVTKPSINKIELKKLCEEYQVPENIVSIVMLQKKEMSILDAVRHVKKTLTGV